MIFPEFVLTLSCPDRRGIVAEVSRFLFEKNCNILDSQQFGDRGNGRFFMRVHGLSEGGISIPALEQAFAAIAQAFAMEAQFFDQTLKTRALIMVSRFGHALVDLLYRIRIGAIAMEVLPICFQPRVDFADIAAAGTIPFVQLADGQGQQTGTGGETFIPDGGSSHRLDRTGPLHANSVG